MPESDNTLSQRHLLESIDQLNRRCETGDARFTTLSAQVHSMIARNAESRGKTEASVTYIQNAVKELHDVIHGANGKDSLPVVLAKLSSSLDAHGTRISMLEEIDKENKDKAKATKSIIKDRIWVIIGALVPGIAYGIYVLLIFCAVHVWGIQIPEVLAPQKSALTTTPATPAKP